MSPRSRIHDSSHSDAQIKHPSAPIPFLNPTRAKLEPATLRSTVDERITSHLPDLDQAPIEHLWRSRDNRKGRHAIRLLARAPPKPIEPSFILPRRTSSLPAIGKGLLRMVTYFPYWDVSYLVGIIFTLGSVIFIIDGFFSWLPLVAPRSEFKNETLVGGGITDIVGATVFEVGSVLMLLEAMNENQTSCFGWAVETVLTKVEADRERAAAQIRPTMDACVHHHANSKAFLKGRRRKESEDPSPPSDGHRHHGVETRSRGRTFHWLPALSELRSHYLHEIGFQASFIQLFGATVYWIPGFTGLPGVLNHLSKSVTNGVYWVPQIVGGACFVVSGFLFTLETQKKWYIPAIRVLGWHIGMWNFIGGIGFALTGALGPASANSGVEYQATLATLWSSTAFLIGSVLQWYESLQKHPVEVKK